MSTSTHSLDASDYKELEKILSQAGNDRELFNAIVNSPFQYKVEMALLFLGIIVFLLVNKKTGTIDRIALSNTEPAEMTKRKSAKPFEDIKIPVDYTDNLIAKAVSTGEPQGTHDWEYLFNPALTPDEAHFNQADGGIAYSAVYPLKARDGGALIFSYFQYPDGIGSVQHEFMQKYSKIAERFLQT